MYESVLRDGEKWNFGIEKGEVGKFLSKYGLSLLEEATPDDLEKRYLLDKGGNVAGRITGTHSLVTANK